MHPHFSWKTPTPAQQEQVAAQINRVFEWAKAKDLGRLDAAHLPTEQFSKFDAPDLELLDLARTNAYERQTFAEDVAEFRFDPKKSIEGLKISTYGGVAVAAFLFHYDATLKDRVELRKTLRVTLVFVDADGKGDWKIAHEHFSAPLT